MSFEDTLFGIVNGDDSSPGGRKSKSPRAKKTILRSMSSANFDSTKLLPSQEIRVSSSNVERKRRSFSFSSVEFSKVTQKRIVGGVFAIIAFCVVGLLIQSKLEVQIGEKIYRNGEPYQEKVADDTWIRHNFDPVKQTLASEKPDMTLKENKKAAAIAGGESTDTAEVYRWSVALSSGTIFSFGRQESGGILPIVKVMTKDGWFVRYYPNNRKSQIANGKSTDNITDLSYVKPKVKGNIIEWEISKGVTARYTMQADRVKADYVVDSRSNFKCQISNDTCSLDFVIETNRGELDRATQSEKIISKQIKEGKGEVSLEVLPMGDIVVFNDLQQEVFTIPAPVSYDKDKKEITTEYKLQKLGEGDGQSFLSLVLSENDLEQAEFPLIIDPQIIDSSAVGTVSSGYGSERNLLRDGWGNMVVLCACTTTNNVWYRSYNATTWTTGSIDLGGTDAAYELGGEFDSDGNIHMVYGDNGDGDLYYRKMTVTRNGSNAITAINGGSDFKLDTIDSAGSAAMLAMTIANKGGGSGVEKVVISYSSWNTATRSSIRVMQCDVSDDCTAAASWKNASEEKDGSGTCSDSATSGGAGLPNASNCKGVTDELFAVASEVNTQASAVQLPGRPKRSPTVKKDASGVFTDLTDATDNNTGTASDLSSLTAATDIYVGDPAQFSKIVFDVTNSNSNVAGWNIAYWNGSAWATTINNKKDNTGPPTLSEDGSLMFDEPSNWQPTTVDGVNKYWARISVTCCTGFDSSVSVAEIYVTDRNARALLVVGGDDSTDDLRAAYIPWDEIGNDRWENNPATDGTGWRSDTGGVNSALSNTGANSTTYTSHPLSMTVDTMNNTAYVTYVFDTTTDELEVEMLMPNGDPTVASNWIDTGFPTVTEGTDITPFITSDRSDIYLFYNLDPGTNSLVWRKCTPSNAGNASLCDHASDWGSENTLVTTTTTQFPKALVSKPYGDTYAFDLIYTETGSADLVYERHFVDMGYVTKTVTVGGDDANQTDCTSGTDDQTIIGTELYLGVGGADPACVGSVASRYHTAMRFQNVAITPGTKIASAYVDFRVNLRTNTTTSLNFDVYGEDENSSAAFGPFSDCTPNSTCTGIISERARTTNKTTVSAPFDSMIYRIDVTKQIQEIVCRGAGSAQPCVGDFNGSGNWTPGGNMSLLFISTQDTAPGSFFITQMAFEDTGANQYKPKLQINLGEVGKEYSAGSVTQLATGSASFANLDHPLATSSGELGAVLTDDANYASISAVNQYASSSGTPAFLFKVNNPNNDITSVLDIVAIVKSSVATTLRPIYLQIYRGGSTNNWETIASNNSSPGDTDITLAPAIVSTSLSDYYFANASGGSCAGSDCWVYFRIYQESPGTLNNETLYVDYANADFLHLPSKIVFTTSNPQVTSEVCSGVSVPVTIELQDNSDEAIEPSDTTVVRITSDSSSYSIYSDSSCASPISNGDITFTTSDTTKTFYFIDSVRGSHNFTAAKQSGPETLTSDSHFYNTIGTQGVESSSIRGGTEIRGGTTIQ